MKKLITNQFWIMMSIFLLSSSVSFSQFNDFDFLRAGPVDAAKLTQAYITPWANAFGAGANGSWYNTAKPHKFGGFDITLTTNVGMVPSSDNTFDVTKIGLSSLCTGTGLAPTISGPDITGPAMTVKQNYSGTLYNVASFNTPNGTDWKLMPFPTLQIGFGLPLGTEIKVRYIPKVTIGGDKDDISSWGIGLMHSIMQYIPGHKLSPFDISVFGGYTILNGNAKINLQPGTPQFYTQYNASTSFNSQKFAMTVQAWNASAIASVNLRVITFYGGLAYSKTSTEISMTGNFPLPTINPAKSLTGPVYEDAGVLKDFPKISINNFSGIRANLGFRLKLGVFTIQADYTRAYYNVVSAGLGLSFR
jgi:hypothetical protein